MRTVSVGGMLVVPVLLLGLGACGDGGSTAADPAPTDAPTSAPVATPTGPASPVEMRVVEATDGVRAPDSESKQRFDALDCSAAPPVPSVPADQPLAACDAAGTKYLLDPAAIVGGVTSARADQTDDTSAGGGATWVVEVSLDDDASAALTTVTTRLAASQQQLAVVVDGRVVSAPTVAGALEGGALQISGPFTHADADALASALQAGG